MKLYFFFNFYGVTATQLTAFVSLCSCNNNISLKMAAKWPKHVGENLVNELHYKH